MNYYTSDNVKDILEILDIEFNLPNIKMKVTDGGIFWSDIAEYKGLRLQQNDISKSARIIDKNNYRIAWGTVNGMLKVMDRMKELEKRYK